MAPLEKLQPKENTNQTIGRGAISFKDVHFRLVILQFKFIFLL